MNLLQHQSSPYLLQHADNPVHWMPWGNDAFQKAQEENKPILVSIGYSSCHWCHVMAHESFEDDQTAQLMNSLFINIKVDREEFPDVDHYYMDALQAMTGSGGWPLNVFITHEKKAFYGGTYFPKNRMQNRASWKETLINVSQYFQQNNAEVEAQAQKLGRHLFALSNPSPLKLDALDDDSINPETICIQVNKIILSSADTKEGGFGIAPKFPSTFSIQFLLDHYALFGNEDSLNHAILSLDKMMMGGIYDQLGGGFSRYSTDANWQVPHFEKMLYDNALLLEVYLTAFQITKNQAYKQIIVQTITWLQREMMNPQGGFYSAQDADSEGVEGKYYSWSWGELKTHVGEYFEQFVNYYQITEEGNWEDTNILWTKYDKIAEVSQSFLNELPNIHERLIAVRNQRIKPLTDDKVILAWNALMNKALAKASLIFDNKEYFILAKTHIDYLLCQFRNDEHLYYHTEKNGIAKIPAYLDDLAYLADASIYFAQVSGEASYLIEAKNIVNYASIHFSDKDSILYNFTNQFYKQVEVSKKDIYDGALPSSNAVMCKVFYYLGHYFMNVSWQQKANAILQYAKPFLQKHPTSFALWATHYQRTHTSSKKVTILGQNAVTYYHQIVNNSYHPNIIFLVSNQPNENILSLPSLQIENETTLILCKENECLPKFSHPDELIHAIK
jgi:uncharacterized protein